MAKEKKFVHVVVSLNANVRNWECLRETPYDDTMFKFEKWTGRWQGFYWDACQYKVRKEYVEKFVAWFKQRIGVDVNVIN